MEAGRIEERIRAVLLYLEHGRKINEIATVMDVSTRTLRRWVRSYREGGLQRLQPRKPGPMHSKYAISNKVEDRILALKQRHPTWGARRIKYQHDLPCHWTTVHRIIKRHGLLVRIKAKPQPSKRFQRRLVDSLWQADTFQFRISNAGKVYVTGFTDDRSRYRVMSAAYHRKSAKEAVNALRIAIQKGRVPKAVYLDNGKQFIAKAFKAELVKHHIKPIYGRPYHPRGRGKIEGYHKILHRELIAQTQFSSLLHFKRELNKFDRRYNHWRKNQSLGWKTPASIYNDRQYFNKQAELKA